MIADFHFIRPWWLLSLIPLALFLWSAARSADIRARWKAVIAPHLLDHLVVDGTAGRRFRPSHLLACLMALGIIAAAGPTWRRELPPFVEDTAALVIAVDLSETMDAVDITPSRLERAKLKIRDLIAARSGARTAILAYAGSAHLVLPLTDDAALLETYVDALSTRIMPVHGKDTAQALALADKTLSGGNIAGTILFVTDGVEQPAFDAFKQDRSGNGLLVLGIGTSEGGPVRTPDGHFLTEPGGAHRIARLDVEALKSLHSETGADVVTVTTDDGDVRWATQRIRTHFDQRIADAGDRWRDAGWWIVIPVALLAALSFRRGWVVPLASLLLLCQPLGPGQPQAQAAEWHFIDAWLTPDQQGRLAFERGDFETAAQHFRDSGWRGAALYRAGKFDGAADAFAAGDTAEDYYNQGNALLHLLKFEEAVASYKQALALRKDWLDAEFNLTVAERLLAAKKKDDEEQQQDPNQAADQVQFDDKGKKGKEGQMNIAEQTSQMWMKNIQVSPADLMARKFAIEAKGSKP